MISSVNKEITLINKTMKELTELRNKVLYLRNTEELSVKGELILLRKLNALKEAINYTRCSTRLKDKEKPTFEEWMEKCGMQKVGNRIILKNNNQVSIGFMLEIYSGQINSGLL